MVAYMQSRERLGANTIPARAKGMRHDRLVGATLGSEKVAPKTFARRALAKEWRFRWGLRQVLVAERV